MPCYWWRSGSTILHAPNLFINSKAIGEGLNVSPLNHRGGDDNYDIQSNGARNNT